LTFDEIGRAYSTSHWGVQMFDPTGRLGGVMSKPAPEFLSGAALAGANRDLLYVTTPHALYVRKIKARGL
jgi:sugar lactone lactonase YvrE